MRRATRLLNSHPDWDLKALNDEMEGLIGKFDDSDMSPPGQNTSAPSPSSVSSRQHDSSINSPEITTTPSQPIPHEIKTRQMRVPISKETGDILSHDKPLYTLFQFDNDARLRDDSFSSDVATVQCKSWQNYPSVDTLMAELAENSSAGIILLQDERTSTETLTQSQKNLLKIYNKSNAVALVIEKNDSQQCRRSKSLESTLSAPHDTSYTTCIIQGLKAEHGVAAAIAGLNSMISEHTKS